MTAFASAYVAAHEQRKKDKKETLEKGKKDALAHALRNASKTHVRLAKQVVKLLVYEALSSTINY